MSSSEVKKRIVNFRLTEEEYRLLRDASTANGARTISDFARSVLLVQSGHSYSTNGAGETISRLELRLAELESKLSMLCAALHVNVNGSSDIFGCEEH